MTEATVRAKDMVLDALSRALIGNASGKKRFVNRGHQSEAFSISRLEESRLRLRWMRCYGN
jgi:hypothetical protein